MFNAKKMLWSISKVHLKFQILITNNIKIFQRLSQLVLKDAKNKIINALRLLISKIFSLKNVKYRKNSRLILITIKFQKKQSKISRSKNYKKKKERSNLKYLVYGNRHRHLSLRFQLRNMI